MALEPHEAFLTLTSGSLDSEDRKAKKSFLIDAISVCLALSANNVRFFLLNDYFLVLYTPTLRLVCSSYDLCVTCSSSGEQDAAASLAGSLPVMLF